MNMDSLLNELAVNLDDLYNGVAALSETVSLGHDADADRPWIVCDSDGMPVVAVSDEDAEAVIRSIIRRDNGEGEGLAWAARWAQAAGYNVQAR